MNKLDSPIRAQVLHLLCEGSSIRAITRLTGVSKKAVTKLLTDAGHACAEYQDRVLRNLNCSKIQVDEIWSFVFCKNDNKRTAKKAPKNAGDAWTWTAICADSKLLVHWVVGSRDTQTAIQFMHGLKERLASRVQLTSDGHRPYLVAVDTVFGEDVDYAMLHKIYGADPQAERRYSPAICLGAEKRIVCGDPDPKHINTSYAERQNLTMRMHMRRFTRLTNGFSKKAANHAAAVSLHAMFYNFVRVHQTLKMSPAMAAGVTDRLWEMSDIVTLIDAWDAKAKREAKPVFEIERWRIGGGYFVRVSFVDGTTEEISGFESEAAAGRWIKNEATAWLYERRATVAA